MKSLFPLLLALSVVGNAALAYLVLTPSTIRPAAPAVSAESSTPAAQAAAAASAGVLPTGAATPTSPTAAPGGPWRTPRTDDELRGLVDNLRAAGYPPSVLRAVVNQVLQDRFAANRPDANQPFWKRMQTTPEMFRAQQARQTEITAAREAALGADGRPSAMFDPVERQRRFGALSDDKVDAILRLEREYNDVRMLTYAARDQNRVAGMQNSAQQHQMIEAEKQADLASLLTPEELAAYELRSSATAQSTMNKLRNVDVTEQEYAALFAVQKSFDSTVPQLSGQVTPEIMAQRTAAQATANEQTRAILGEDRFYQYLEGADHQYAQVSTFTKQYPQVTPAQAYQVYQLQTELQTAMMTQRGGSAEARTQVIERLNARLNQILPPDVAEAYRSQGSGRMFRTPTARPGTPATGNAVTPFMLPGGG